MHLKNNMARARRIACLGSSIGFAVGLLATGPSLVSSGFSGTVVLMAIPILLSFSMLGAWFPVICRLSELDPGDDGAGANELNLSDTARHSEARQADGRDGTAEGSRNQTLCGRTDARPAV